MLRFEGRKGDREEADGQAAAEGGEGLGGILLARRKEGKT